MAVGLYIHIPFCIKKCNYCDFVSYPYDAGLAASYVCALEKEMASQVRKLTREDQVVESIYLGGGTPTTLSGEHLASILHSCRRNFRLSADVEITVECNPCTVDPGKLTQMYEAGVNRISIGVQAYQQKLLSVLGRTHSWQEVETAVVNTRQAGFDNISFDIIFGIPGQSMHHWQETLDRVCSLSPRHISAYNLKIEPDTPLHRDVTAGYLVPCDEEIELEMYWYTVDFLTRGGFTHYEISNFALPGGEARHNLIYWLNRDYLGLGPAAHSKINVSRFSNVESVELYISRINRGEPVISSFHPLSPEERMSETVFLGLRIISGLDIDLFEQEYGASVFSVYGKQIDKLMALGLLEIAGNRLRLTDKGLPLANVVFAEFV